MADDEYQKDFRMDDHPADHVMDSYGSLPKDTAQRGVDPAGGPPAEDPECADKFCSTADERLDSAYGSSSLTVDSLSEIVRDISLCTDDDALTDTPPVGLLTNLDENLLTTIFEDGDTILHLAIIHEDELFAYQLIWWFPRDVLDIQNNLYQTPLHLATYLDLPSVVWGLAGNGASLELQDRDGNTPLHVACEHGREDCGGAMTRDISPAKLSPVLETQNWRGLTCLHVATLNGHLQLVKLLIEKGADLDSQEGTSGKSALHLAVERHDVALVALLLGRGADVDTAMFNGCTPLHLAVGRRDAAVANLLCQAGADKMVRNTEDETPMDLADGNDDILALFPFDDIQISGRSVVAMKF